MRKTKYISLVILPLLAISCKADHYQHCVDDNENVVDDTLCNPNTPNTSGHPYRFYYSPRMFSPGMRVSGGSWSPSPGRSYSSPSLGRSYGSSSISRGGFGSSGSSFSSGGGE